MKADLIALVREVAEWVQCHPSETVEEVVESFSDRVDSLVVSMIDKESET